VIDRFWSKVNKTEGGCWEWTAAKDGSGYGLFRWQRRMVRVHRVSFELVHGPIPEDLHVCHRCDNRGCVNPDHLFLGTHRDNMTDMSQKGRARTPLGEDNLQAKLTRVTVREVRQAEGSQRQIAKRFGISQSQVSRIRGRRFWQHI
jgi:hypothetical protein